MLWRWASWCAGAALLIAAGMALALTVRVPGAGGRSASCGSGWDVVAGRAGWQQWWAHDLGDPAGNTQLVRTDSCPDAVNDRIVTSGALAAGAVAVVFAGALVPRRRRERPGQGRRLRLVGAGVTVLGGVLTVAGLAGLALLTADPNASLFLYVSRTAVVLVGLLLLLPAVLLIVVGRGMSVLAEHLAEETRDETP